MAYLQESTVPRRLKTNNSVSSADSYPSHETSIPSNRHIQTGPYFRNMDMSMVDGGVVVLSSVSLVKSKIGVTGHIEYKNIQHSYEDDDDDDIVSDKESIGLIEDKDLNEDLDQEEENNDSEDENDATRRSGNNKVFTQSAAHVMSIENLVGPST
ncbi:hypothetical protein BGZ80_001159 [Entomortierella chlamydospora]|uniref:Uncharacterized protein n=1 Tax=Entomortierella chlamydospora TaxID=101097 RepID=A0A9P6T401_9FUNG|nr:hypothetical protein BGZ79_008829 [Entomortierella chlamydospora]KAG0022054.1 hypothetical protein BGZ80_001159 [Entomortierella chlamydospora]